ncbi:hypothetical protein V491_07592 [Pseudogymnoascus sp. VKM F-3775]|nr:hypothetical protein V491_07592 [Pseudogymnoascus sp. VKM F-3775]
MSQVLELPTELRIIIFTHLLTADHPFMIGRCEGDSHRKAEGRLRVASLTHRGAMKATWNDRKYRPIQSAITRVCSTFREEALPLWYSENRFWLIHNEFAPDFSVPNPHRGFHACVSQTPREMFDLMQHVSLCGYTSWPYRVMITLDLKNRQVVGIRYYASNGKEVPIHQQSLIDLNRNVPIHQQIFIDSDRRVPTNHQSFIDSTRQALASKADEDGFAALQAVLAERDDIFEIKRRYLSLQRDRMTPASG